VETNVFTKTDALNLHCIPDLDEKVSLVVREAVATYFS
jgi:hypothetical protein